MVNMASSPTPQSVGREFVRQYYTMLNQAPLHQHRFYSTNSSFVHGGSERKGGATDGPVYGQQDIHARITQLNFNDCKAKIRQVDAHSTLGNGVVVQVCGELSNRGMPLRRFMQTFVLAPQSPKKYYVINDIFRYQDDVFSDDENDDADADDESDGRSNNASLDNSGGSQPPQQLTADVIRRTAGPLSDAVAAENFKNVEMSANAAAAAAAAAVTAVATAATHQQAVKQLPGSQTGVGVGGDGITTVSITQQLAVDPLPKPDNAARTASNQQTTLAPKDTQVNGQLPKSDQVTSPARDQQPPGQVLHPQLPDVAASAAARATVTAASPPQQQQVVSPKPTPPKPEPKPAETSVAAAPEPKSEPETKVAEKSVESVSQVPPSYATLVKSSGPPSGTGAMRAISPGSLPSAGFNKNPLGPSLSTGATGSSGAAGTTSSETQVSSAGGSGPNATTGVVKDSFASAASSGAAGVQGGPKTARPSYGGRGSAGSAGRTSSTTGGSVRGYSESRTREERDDHSRQGDRPRDNRNMPGAGYPDSQQIFVGNLPHTVTEEDLKALFGDYGEVIEIRISIKGVQQSKLQPAGQKVPNFGFVVFADDEAARKCLDDTPIKLPDGHRLNVETKKNKQNMREARLNNSESYHSDHRGGPSGGSGGPNASSTGGVKARLSSTSSNSGANNSFGGSQEQLGNNRWSGGGRGGGPRGGLGGSGRGRGGFGRGSAPLTQGSSSGGPSSRGAYSSSRGSARP